MSGASTPQTLLEPIAADAAPGNITDPMPDAPPGSNAASVQLGFPPITMESELAGGLPPLGQDMNGFMFLLSSHLFALQAGQGYQFNASVASAAAMGGGYAAGAVLEMADGTGFWLSTVNNNTTNPDTGGAGWVPLTTYGITTVSATGGTVTLSAAQAKYPVIVVSGALVSNLSLNFPNRLGRWLVINSTTGAFTTTALTAASGSTGVSIPQGGPSSPVGVYCIADGNIYPVVAPLSVAISQAPTPLTLVERTNTGVVTATSFNQNSALVNPLIGALFVQSTAADGFLQKISPANALLQLLPSVVSSGGNQVQLGKFILKCGYAQGPGISPAPVAVTFSPNFPNAFLAAICSTKRSTAGADGSGYIASSPAPTVSGMTCIFDALDGLNNVTNGGYWFALGY